MDETATKPKRASQAGAATRAVIMDVAEEMISAFGPEAVSVRDLAKTAGVNLGAVNYHFGSKENLFKEVVERLILPLNGERLELLEKALKLAPLAQLPAILRAFLQPLYRLAWDPQHKARVVVISRYLNDAFSTPEGGRAVILEYYEPVRRAFIEALQACLPHLPLAEIVWRYNSMVGVTLYALGGIERLAAPPTTMEQARKNGDLETALARSVRFLEAGFLAPATSEAGA